MMSANLTPYERVTELPLPASLAVAVARADAGEKPGRAEVTAMLRESVRSLDDACISRSGINILLRALFTVLLSAIGVADPCDVMVAIDSYRAVAVAIERTGGIAPVDEAATLSAALEELIDQLELPAQEVLS